MAKTKKYCILVEGQVYDEDYQDYEKAVDNAKAGLDSDTPEMEIYVRVAVVKISEEPIVVKD